VDLKEIQLFHETAELHSNTITEWYSILEKQFIESNHRNCQVCYCYSFPLDICPVYYYFLRKEYECDSANNLAWEDKG